ncbi:Surface antigen [Riemerella columbipharyngis]|uniref:Surface antigen n=2 Tax=Riemerella columbipharyngis TaxID=1071918 RepID=A0A1G6YHL8_9FLAO|nr:Surface antigen [Riemerella columbipharyngis]
MVIIFSNSCSTTNKVPRGEYLLTKNKFKYTDKKIFSSQIPDYIAQKPNKKFLFLFPITLWAYDLANPKYDTIINEYMTYPNQMRNQALRDSLFIKYGHPEYKGKSMFISRFLHSIGSVPVILNESKTENSAKNIKQFLVYKGYWDAETHYDINKDIMAKKAKVTYSVKTGTPTIIKNFYYNIPDKNIRALYERNYKDNKIKIGMVLDQTNLEKEIKRINAQMQQEGYYNFNRNNNEIYFTADTLESQKDVPLTMDIHRDSLDTPYRKTTIGKIDIYLINDRNIKDTLKTKDYTFNEKQTKDSVFIHKADNKYNTRALWLPITLKHGEVYNQSRLDLTKRNLMGMNNFNIISYKEYLQRKPNDSILNVRYILSPMKRYELRTAMDVHYSQILNFGFSPSLELTSRNIFGGGENLSTSFSGIVGTTKNAKNPNKLFNAYELSAQVELDIPRLLVPFKYYNFVPKRYTPSSSIVLGTSVQNNIGMGRINFNAGLNYTMDVNSVISHKLSLFNTQLSLTQNKEKYYELFTGDNLIREKIFNLYAGYNPSYGINGKNYDEVSSHILSDNGFINSLPTEQIDEYNTFVQSLLNKDRQTQDVLITSLIYNYLYNERGNKSYTNPFYFNGKIELAGNIPNLITQNRKQQGVLSGKEKTIFGIPFSQFVKFDLDARKYFNFTLNDQKTTLAIRQFIGIGIPYGNSSSMPFVRSYFNGGSNDIRAWVAFSGLGPADSQLDSKIRSYIMDNVKLTTSIEYRYPFSDMFEGAIFTDAGNIWSLKNRGLNDEFKFNKFYKQLGVGSGFGLRINVAYVLLRVDLAYKMYDPNEPEGQRWQFRYFKPLKPTLNFAFGYPF